MKTKKKNVFYCEHCKKHGLSSYHMAEHEKHCTGNPYRDCRMCGSSGLMEFFIRKEMEGGFERRSISVSEEDCPACVLAFIRHFKITDVSYLNESSWEYKKAVKIYWEIKQENESSNY